MTQVMVVLLCAALMLLLTGTARAEEVRDLYPDTWVATDALGRALPGYAECGPPKADRTVGIFYFINHGTHQESGPFDVTKILAANPENPQWGKGSHHWGEPELGYYLADDDYVTRRHARQLADAGVDVIIFDVTNGRTFFEIYTNICRVYTEMRAQGEGTPQIAFLAHEQCVHQLYKEFYSKGLYRDLWFLWKGKPLLMFGQHIGWKPEAAYPREIRDFFTMRASWAWDSLPWYGEGGYHRWPWIAHYPQPVGWDVKGEAEYVPVGVGQHPVSGIGRSYHDGKQPPVDRYDVTPFTDEGLHFQEQWGRALEVDPAFVFVTGWNEWIAGRFTFDGDYKNLWERFCFFPGAKMGRATRALNKGDTLFIDQYNREFSRDAEPMKGGHTDDYYYQLVANVRRYKGVRVPEAAGPAKTIDLAGPFTQWTEVRPEFRNHAGSTDHRNHPGWGDAGPYVNTTGRNDIIASKVAHDDTMVYLYVACSGIITPSTDPFWMLLFLDADQNHATGWEGYDYLVNAEIVDGSTTAIQRWDGQWRDAGRARFRVEGRELMIALPREAVGQTDRVAFDFHWADNIQKLGDITEFFINGDSAPPRRFNYRYVSAG